MRLPGIGAMKVMFYRKAIAGVLILMSANVSVAQIIRAGIKAGPQLSWFKSDDPKYKPVADIHPVVGFNAGAVFSFKVKDRYFLNTEFIYSQKGKNVTGKIDPDLNDKVTYRHIDVPILFALHFKGHISESRQFKWYLNAGPNISYWLGGNGVIKSGDLLEGGIPELKYKIKFGTRPNHDDPDILYIKDAQRFQWGLNIGGGILLEPGGNQKVMVDLRYEIGHTQLGTRTSSQFEIPSDYQDSLKGRNKGLRLSIIYMVEFSSSKKDLNKGKSTKKVR